MNESLAVLSSVIPACMAGTSPRRLEKTKVIELAASYITEQNGNIIYTVCVGLVGVPTGVERYCGNIKSFSWGIGSMLLHRTPPPTHCSPATSHPPAASLISPPRSPAISTSGSYPPVVYRERSMTPAPLHDPCSVV